VHILYNDDDVVEWAFCDNTILSREVQLSWAKIWYCAGGNKTFKFKFSLHLGLIFNDSAAGGCFNFEVEAFIKLEIILRKIY
jgi:hypothetical protein